MFVRTVLLYFITVLIMRLTGKRQIGQLELTELVTAFMVSELASMPISNNAIPLLYGVVPALTIVCLETFLSYASVKSHFLRKLLEGSELALIRKGKIDVKLMNRARITVDELKSAMRLAGITSLGSVEYAFLESNGNISVIPKSSEAPATAGDLGINIPEKGVEHSLIIDGEVLEKELRGCGYTNEKLTERIKSEGYASAKEVFYFGADDLGNVFIIGKERKS